MAYKINEIYPPSPTHIPANLLSITPEYRKNVVRVVMGIVGFGLLYLLLMVVGAGLAVGAIFFSIHFFQFIKNWFILLTLLCFIVSALLLFIMMVEKLFVSKPLDLSYLEEINRDNEPLIFDFVKKVCSEIKSPIPHHIYLHPEATAFVFYKTSIWNLIFTPRKHLVIGYPLLCKLNLSDFKSLIAHEMGHFSQKSMGLSSYVIVSKQIILENLNNNNAIIRFIEKMSEQKSFIAVGTYLPRLYHSFCKFILKNYFIELNKMLASLGRQMEYDADLISVSITGSKSIPILLYKCEISQIIVHQTINELMRIEMEGYLSKNLYSTFQKIWNTSHIVCGFAKNHQISDSKESTEDGPFIDDIFKILQLNNDRIFDSNFEFTQDYDSHPSNARREDNAKRIFVECEVDERPASILLPNLESHELELTRIFYKQNSVYGQGMNKFVQVPIEVIQSTLDFIHLTDDDTVPFHKTIVGHLLPYQYDEMYQNSLTLSNDITILLEEIDKIENEIMPNLELNVVEHQQKYSFLVQIIEDARGKSFTFDGIEYRPHQVEKAYEQFETKATEIQNECSIQLSGILSRILRIANLLKQRDSSLDISGWENRINNLFNLEKSFVSFYNARLQIQKAVRKYNQTEEEDTMFSKFNWIRKNLKVDFESSLSIPLHEALSSDVPRPHNELIFKDLVVNRNLNYRSFSVPQLEPQYQEDFLDFVRSFHQLLSYVSTQYRYEILRYAMEIYNKAKNLEAEA